MAGRGRRPGPGHRPAGPRRRSVRIGSVTKIFVSTVVLQLVGEGRFALDDPIERHLPGVLPGGGDITVRQLLNRTSGLQDYSDDPRIRPNDDAGERQYLSTGRWVEYSPQELVAIGTYVKLPEGPADVTRISPTVADAAGAGISTTADLNRFHAALFGGRLLTAAQLAEMTTTADVPGGGRDEYGLGLIHYRLSCGDAWGHIGDMPGYSTALLGTADGSRQFTLSTNEYDKSDPEKSDRLYQALVDKALCGTTSG